MILFEINSATDYQGHYNCSTCKNTYYIPMKAEFVGDIRLHIPIAIQSISQSIIDSSSGIFPFTHDWQSLSDGQNGFTVIQIPSGSVSNDGCFRIVLEVIDTNNTIRFFTSEWFYFDSCEDMCAIKNPTPQLSCDGTHNKSVIGGDWTVIAGTSLDITDYDYQDILFVRDCALQPKIKSSYKFFGNRQTTSSTQTKTYTLSIEPIPLFQLETLQRVFSAGKIDIGGETYLVNDYEAGENLFNSGLYYAEIPLEKPYCKPIIPCGCKLISLLPDCNNVLPNNTGDLIGTSITPTGTFRIRYTTGTGLLEFNFANLANATNFLATINACPYGVAFVENGTYYILFKKYLTSFSILNIGGGQPYSVRATYNQAGFLGDFSNPLWTCFTPVINILGVQVSPIWATAFPNINTGLAPPTPTNKQVYCVQKLVTMVAKVNPSNCIISWQTDPTMPFNIVSNTVIQVSVEYPFDDILVTASTNTDTATYTIIT